MPVMPPGMSGRARPPAACPPARRPRNGGFTFAEDPGLAAPDARLLWHADLDPGTLRVTAEPGSAGDPESFSIASLSQWLMLVADCAGQEHAVLSDGWHHIRLDVEKGSLARTDTVILSCRLRGIASTRTRLLPLRRFVELCRHRRFLPDLFPPDPWIQRWLTLLRVHDALAEGATQREIGTALFGEERVLRGWAGRSDSLRSRVRRLSRAAGVMARGGYRLLMRRR
jgi:hypothetical protein